MPTKKTSPKKKKPVAKKKSPAKKSKPKKRTIGRNSKDGKFTTKKFVKDNPDITETEQI